MPELISVIKCFMGFPYTNLRHEKNITELQLSLTGAADG